LNTDIEQDFRCQAECDGARVSFEAGWTGPFQPASMSGFAAC
jgi:hypothetical protein